MVFLAITRSGFESFVRLARRETSLWIGADLLATSEIALLREQGLDITCFTYPILPNDSSAIFDAVETIREHHSGECVWVES